jgi:hypothetical protein
MFKTIRLFLLISLLLPFAGCGNGVNKLAGSIKLTQNQMNIINGIQNDGLISSINCPIAYVPPFAWESNQYLLKEGAAKVLAKYCQNESVLKYDFNTYTSNNKINLALSSLFSDSNPNWIILKDDVSNKPLLECLNDDCKSY